MAFNYGNMANPSLENILPLLNSRPQPNFINQLAAAITAQVGQRLTPNVKKREKTPEPPPAPILGNLISKNNKQIGNQGGTAPMDIENENELDNLNLMENKAKRPAQLSDNVFLNNLMSTMGGNTGIGSANTASTANYMYFPNTNTSTSSAASMLLDPSSMMAVMQQLQQQQQGYLNNWNLNATDANVAENHAILTDPYAVTGNAANAKDVIKTKNATLFPPNPSAAAPTIRDRPPGCRTVFVGGLPENISDEIIREIFESCGEISTLRMSKKNFCHIRFRHEASIDHAIYLSGYRLRINMGSSTENVPANFGRLHVDYALARDDKFDYECKQRQLEREQRHRRMSTDRNRSSQSPPPIPHYSEHEATLLAENLRNNDTFIKAVQTVSCWLERGDCNKRNANVFYSMIQSTSSYVRRLHGDKQQLEEDLRKARESYRKQMLIMSTQFTQIEKVFNAASHKKVWDHFTKNQRKNIDQWKKLATELRSVQIEDDEMEISDDEREHQSSRPKRARFDSESLKEENDSLRCQLEAIRNEMSSERTDIKYNSDFCEKQIKVLHETIRNMQTQVLQTKMREQKDQKLIEQLERKLKEAGVKQLLLKTRIKETSAKLRDSKDINTTCSIQSETSESNVDEIIEIKGIEDNDQIIDIDAIREDEDEVKIIEEDSIPNENFEEINENEIFEEREESTVEINENENTGAANKMENCKEPKENEIVEETKQNMEKQNQKLIGDEKLKLDCKEKWENSSITESTFFSTDSHEVKIIALMSAFLVVHPMGCSLNGIVQYLSELNDNNLMIKADYINDILQKYTNIFELQADRPVEDDKLLNNKWKFCGFIKTELSIKQN